MHVNQASNCSLDKASTPVNIHVLEQMLASYPHKQTAKFLIDGFKNGFNLQCTNPPTREHEPSNLKSVLMNPIHTANKIQKEVIAGNFGGPWDQPPLKNMVISPIGLREKKVKGTYRLIHHLSYPKGAPSVNSGIAPESCTVKYASFDHAIQIIQAAGPGCEIGKEDVFGAFTLLPVRPQDLRLTGFKFNDKYYLQKTLPMGCSISSNYYERFGTFLEWRTKKESKLNSTSHYCDDHMFSGRKGTGQCLHLMNTFKSVCKRLHVPLCADKEVLPCTCMVYLGFTIDTVKQWIIIPSDKIQDAITKLAPFVETVKIVNGRGNIVDKWAHSKVTRAHCEYVVGLLQFITRAIVMGRAFIYRIRDLIYTVKEQHHHIRITEGVRSDAKIWVEFLQKHNGVTYFLETGWKTHLDLGLNIWCDEDKVHISYKDICWAGSWGHSLKQYASHVVFREIAAICLTVSLLGSQLKNLRIYFPCQSCDTITALYQLYHQDWFVMALVRHFVLITLEHNIFVRGRVVPRYTDNFCHLQTKTSDANYNCGQIPGDLWQQLASRL